MYDTGVYAGFIAVVIFLFVASSRTIAIFSTVMFGKCFLRSLMANILISPSSVVWSRSYDLVRRTVLPLVPCIYSNA